jgi:hypothetical protein
MRTFILAAVMTMVAVAVCKAQEPTTPAPPSANIKHVAGDIEQMRVSLDQLTTENERLRTKVAGLERRLRNQSIRDRMTQEEQRAENLEEQLFSIAKEEANLQAELEEVTEQLRPENIQQLPIMGSLRPEEIRESTRRKLDNRQMRLQAQLHLLEQSRSRISSSISVTDMLIQNLRMQMQAAATHP